MTLQQYQLLEQWGAGLDGVAYRARTTDGRMVELRLLQAARADTVRWSAVAKRLRTVAMLGQRAVRHVAELGLDEDPPYIVVEEAERCLADECQGRLPWPAADTQRWAEAFAEGLAAGHRLGLTHGDLSPATVCLAPDAMPKIDFTGLNCGTAGTLDDLASSCRAPELVAGEPLSPAADLYALGRIIAWLLTGRSSVTLTDKADDPLRQTAVNLGQTTDLPPPELA